MRQESFCGACQQPTPRGSTRMADPSKSTLAPRAHSICMSTWTSSMSGRFSTVQGSSHSSVAGMMATAVFLPPLTCTTPSSLRPPVMNIFSIVAKAVSPVKRRASGGNCKWSALYYTHFRLDAQACGGRRGGWGFGNGLTSRAGAATIKGHRPPGR